MPDPAASKKIVFNGVRARGGGYALELTPSQIKDLALGKTLDPRTLNELKRKKKGPMRSFDLGARGMESEGWGLILPASLDLKSLQARLDALRELLDWRLSTAGGRFKIFSGEQGYLPETSKREWLMQVGANPDGPPEPDKVPKYLLIAGSPDEIPYSLQYQLDVQYHTGRIHFDRLEDWANYAHSVVEVEKHGLLLPRQVGVFAPANPNDEATHLSHDTLAKPLCEFIRSRYRLQHLKERLISQIHLKGSQYTLEAREYSESELRAISQQLNLPFSDQEIPLYQLTAALGEGANRNKLEALLGGAETPALFFSASHGMVFDADDPGQQRQQGALLCQDWQGPSNYNQDVNEKMYFAGDHLGSDAHLLGMLAFFFACYGGGTPQYDEFVSYGGKVATIAKKPFTAELPMRMLAHPHGSALAVVGHVERAWASSFQTENNRPQGNVFEKAFGQLLDGSTLGEAMDTFNLRYAELATDISDIQNKTRIPSYILDEIQLSDMWIRHNDARNYLILGDPSVKLPVAAQPRGERKLALELHSLDERSAPSPLLQSLLQNALGGKIALPAAPLAPQPAAEVYETAPTGAMIDYSWFGKNFDQSQKDFAAALKHFVDEMSAYVGKIANEVNEMKVETYLAPDLARVDQNGHAQNAELISRTVISLSGDTRLELSRKNTPELNHTHLEMVQLAQQNRIELLKTLAGSLVGLKDLLKP